MRVAITGGFGFIGQEIVSEYIAAGHDVVIVDFWEDLIPKYEKYRYPIIEKIYENSMRVKDILDPWQFLEKLKSERFDVIVHAGAVVDTTDMGSSTMWDRNVRYTEQLTLLSGRHTPVVFMSSAAVYGVGGPRSYPMNPYAFSKVMGEKYVNRNCTRSSVLRLFNVFGKFEHHKLEMASMPFKLAEHYKLRSRLKMHSPDASRDFVPVKNVASIALSEGHRLLTGTGPHHLVRDVGTGCPTTFSDLDLYVMHARHVSSSEAEWVDMPPQLIGRYQGFTRANEFTGPLTTRDGIEAYYGK